jgi:hypothetical protein
MMPSDIWVLRLSQTTRHACPCEGEGCDWRRRGEQIGHETDEVLFGAGIADGAADRASGDVERGDQGFGAEPDVFELTPFDVSRFHRQAPGW